MAAMPPALVAANLDASAAETRIEGERFLFKAACLLDQQQVQVLRRQAAHDLLDALYDAYERQQRALRNLYHGK